MCFFVSETKHNKRWMKDFKWRLNMPNMVVKDSEGTGGGLAMF
jgi:hypothetical protein